MFRFVRPVKLHSSISSRFMSSRPSEQVDRSRLDGRVAIVTAGSNGIGLAIAKRLARNGAHVVVSSRNQNNVDRAVSEIKDLGYKASGIACHFGKEEEREHLLKKTVSDHGCVHILIQNAGVNPHAYGIMSTPESVIDKTCEVHVKGNFRMIQQIAPYMSQSYHQGSIVLTSSVSAYAGHLYPGAYGVTKAAVIAMTRSFMVDLYKMNIRINCLTMSGIETDFLARPKENVEAREEFLKNVPVGRFGSAEECAGLAAYLASDDSSYVTGENFVIAGGVYTRF